MTLLFLLLPVVTLVLGYRAGFSDGHRAGLDDQTSRRRVRRVTGMRVVAGGRLR